MFTTKFTIELYLNYKSVYDEGNASGDTLLPFQNSEQKPGKDLPSGLADAGINYWYMDGSQVINFPTATGSPYVVTLIVRKI